MRRSFIAICLTLAAAVSLAVAPVAPAAKRPKVKTPTITRVQPMRLAVGQTLTIKGSNFSPRKARNTVVFRAPNGQSAFAKPRRASGRRLVVVVPAAIARLLVTDAGTQKATRFKIRVLNRKFSKYTSRRLSPVIVGSNGADGGPGSPGNAACNDSADHDGDLLTNSFELAIKTDPCLRDTDLDGVEDGYEFQSAVDLNHYPRTLPLPYPGKRPYPNALDSSDAPTDYDGDGLHLSEEYTLWIRFAGDGVARNGRPGSLASLVYSDGLQKSVDPAPAVPADVLGAWALDIDRDGETVFNHPDGVLWDDERDADADGLGNWDEQHGRMTEAWWPSQHDGVNEPKESKYPLLDFLDNEDTAPAYDAFADADMDGDGVLDGADDNDHDGLSNQFEVNRPSDWGADAIVGYPTAANPWAYVNPFNPCKPFDSERCHQHPPFNYYVGDEVPPIGPAPPAGYPGTHPPTPNG